MTRALDADAYRALQGLGQRVFDPGPMPDNNSDWEGWTLRQVVQPTGAVPGKRFRVSIQTLAGTTNCNLTGAWIGQRAISANPDFDGRQVQIKFDGSNVRALDGAETIVSDEIELSFDSTRPLLVSLQFDGVFGSGNVANLASNFITSSGPTGSEDWQKSGNDAAATLGVGYTFAGNDTVGIVSIEAAGTVLVARDFVAFVVRDRVTGDPVLDGYWSDYGDFSASVINPETGGAETRTFFGAAGLISISDIPLISTLTVQQISITLNQVSDRINDLLRTYDCKQGQVIVWRGLFNPNTRLQAGPAYPRFVGFIDEAPVTTPAENQVGSVTLTCTSHTQELTRANSDTRSDASQKIRSATDNFFQDAGVVGTWEHFWGREAAKIQTGSNQPQQQTRK